MLGPAPAPVAVVVEAAAGVERESLVVPSDEGVDISAAGSPAEVVVDERRGIPLCALGPCYEDVLG